MQNRARVAVVATLAMTSVWGLTACSDSGELTESDVYKIGCPAIDAVAAGGSLAGKAALAGLEKLRDEPVLGDDARMWVGAAVDVLSSKDPSKLSAEAKSTLAKGCADNGYELRNLK